MNQEERNRLKRLARRAHSVWSGGWAHFPIWMDDGSQPPFRPRVPAWVNEREGGSHVGHLADPRTLLQAQAALAALLDFAGEEAYLPGSVVVNDRELAAFLERELGEWGISVRWQASLPALDELERIFADSEGGPRVRSLLTAPGIDDALLARYATAATALYQAAPWRYLVDQDYLLAEGDHPPTMGCACVLGAGKQTEGLSFFPSPQELFAFAEGNAIRSGRITGGCVTFEPLSAIPPDDAARWVSRGWSVSPKRLYPLCSFFERGKMRGPTVQELIHATEWMEALGATSEAEIDSGRCEKPLGEPGRRLVMSLPNVLEGATNPAMRPRGQMFDRRSMESLHAKIARYFEEHPADSLEEMNRVLAEKFSGPIDDLPEPEPRNPAEQAQQLCYQAFDAYGRRRVLLARQAIEIDPDCADAHNLLAEAAYEPADALQHFERALAAAQRSLGQQFEESVGHFWGNHATRPYMRAREGCACMLDQLGRTDEAIEHAREMLRLNPNDNQGMRYSLLAWLLKAGADEPAGKLLKQYDERSAHWAYGKALLAFRLSGRAASAERELAAAVKVNRHVPDRLLSGDEFQHGTSYSPGSPEEAEFAARELLPAYASTPGALQWLSDNSRQAVSQAVAHDRAARRKQLERKKREQTRGKRKRR